MSALHFATRLVWTLSTYCSWTMNNSVDHERGFWRRRNTKCWGHIGKYVHLSFWAFWNGCTSCQHFGWKLPYFTWISCYSHVTPWSKYHTECHMQEISYHLHHCTWLTSPCRMTEHLTRTLNFRCFTSHCHTENTISGSHRHVRLLSLMYTKHQVWPVLDYDEITKWVDRKLKSQKWPLGVCICPSSASVKDVMYKMSRVSQWNGSFSIYA